MKSSISNCCAIIITYNGIEWIERCISGLENSSKKIDIIVVDNGSSDRTKEFLSKKSEVKLFENKENIGFGKANNIGLRYAYEVGYKSFFLLNQDAWVENETILQLFNYQKDSPEFGILSPVHMNGDGQALDAGFERYMRLRKSSGFFQDFKRNMVKKSIYEVSFVNAAAWMISRNCLSQVGLFHPLFNHYGEDDNYVHRTREKGLKVGVLGSVKVYHARDKRFRSRIHPKAKFRSMVIMSHLNPLKKRGNILLWLISMKNLFSISVFWFMVPNPSFYFWGILNYHQILRKIKSFQEKDYDLLL